MTKGLVRAKDDAAHRVTELLMSWSSGDESAFADLVPLVLDELKRIARRHMRSQRNGHVLQTTALVNEAYIRLCDLGGMRWQDRTHFLAMASRLMRRVLVDFARAEASQKRGGGYIAVTLDEASATSGVTSDLIALDDALGALARIDPRKSQVVELRFFGGLSVDETAMFLKVSSQTVLRDWRLAKSWLLREINEAGRTDRPNDGGNQ
jgi:RNA polymerase sigma factor (TIGR02999 family)